MFQHNIQHNGLTLWIWWCIYNNDVTLYDVGYDDHDLNNRTITHCVHLSYKEASYITYLIQYTLITTAIGSNMDNDNLIQGSTQNPLDNLY